MSKIIIGRSSSAFDKVVPSFDHCFELWAKIKMFSRANLPKKLKYAVKHTFGLQENGRGARDFFQKQLSWSIWSFVCFHFLTLPTWKVLKETSRKREGGSIHNKELLVRWPTWGTRPKRESGTLTAFLSISFKLILLLKIVDPPIKTYFYIKDGKQRKNGGKCLEKEYIN